MKFISFLIIFAGMWLSGCIPVSAQEKLLGGDISLLPSYLEKGTEFRTQSGRLIKRPLRFFRQQGWNAMRVRLFVDPEKAPSSHKGEGVCQDLDYVIALSKDIKRAGHQLMLDFHYSDTWADPGKQFIPNDWLQVDSVALPDTLYQYTRRCLEEMVKAGCSPELIQVGNEITFGMLWPKGKVDPMKPERWSYFCQLLNSGVKACREVCPQAKIIIHTEHAQDSAATLSYYEKLAAYGVDYDIIGLSYYPMWHERLPILSETLNMLEREFPQKPVMIVETAFYYSHENDRWAKPSQYSEYYPISIEGQRQFTAELVAELNHHKNVTGLFWWFPEENGYKNTVTKGWLNRGLFNNRTGRALPALLELKRFR